MKQAVATTTFNGSLSLEYNSDYTYASSAWNDNPAPTDDGYNNQNIGSGTSHFVTEGLSAEYKEDNATHGILLQLKSCQLHLTIAILTKTTTAMIH